MAAAQKISIEDLRDLMGRLDNVRNMSVIAHVDHGKTTLTDSLLSKAGFMSTAQAGGKRATDTREDEQLRGITIKSTAVSMYYEVDADDREYIAKTRPVDGPAFLVNLIDSPGHVDFSSEVTAALRVTDGAMVVVDAASGVCVQTETVLRQALGERIKPVLMINKMDRCIIDQQYEPEDLYQNLLKTIEKCNEIIYTYVDEDSPMGDLRLDPSKGNVGFGSGLHGWGFTLHQFAKYYSKLLKNNEDKMMKRLWGEQYYNEKLRKWNTIGGEGYERGFNKFVLGPIFKILRWTMVDKQPEKAIDLAKRRLGVNFSAEEEELREKPLMKTIMKQWLPAGDGMLQMIVRHLPSPKQAQEYRTEILYEGPMDDEAAIGMKKCDPNAPVMMYVSKMIPSNDRSRFTAFGRVFSGTVRAGQQVRIMTPNYVPGENHDINIKKIRSTVVMICDGAKGMEDVPCGNVCGLEGIDKFLVKTGTISTFEGAHNLRVLKFSVSPVVMQAVKPKDMSKLPKLLEGMTRLAKSDPMVVVTKEGDQNIIAGAGALHLEICLNDLREFAGVELEKTDPIVTYQETVTGTSPSCLAKTANKHNKIYMEASPLDKKLVDDIVDGVIYPTQDFKTRARYLVDNYDWEVQQARKIWCFGPEGKGPNLLNDGSRAVQDLNDLKDMIVAGFNWATKEGPLCEENMRGVKFSVLDATVHCDAAQRKGPQVIPAARRCSYSSFLKAKPKLMEPVYLVEIQVPEQMKSKIYNIFGQKRGKVNGENNIIGTPLWVMNAHLPVNESFSFNEELRAQTSGQAFPTLVFDHWAEVPGDPYTVDTLAGKIVQEVRVRKGLSATVPDADYYLDKI